MVALMRYECGLKFTGCVFENMNIAQKWLEENGWCNPRRNWLGISWFYRSIYLDYGCQGGQGNR